MVNVTVTLVCEKGHQDEGYVHGVHLQSDGLLSFGASSSWDFCDDCGEYNEDGEYVVGSVVRSEASRNAGFKVVAERHKDTMELTSDELASLRDGLVDGNMMEGAYHD